MTVSKRTGLTVVENVHHARNMNTPYGLLVTTNLLRSRLQR